MEIKEIIREMEENFNQYYRLLEPVKDNNTNANGLKKLLESLANIEDEVIDFRLKKIQEEEHPYLPSIQPEKMIQINAYRSAEISDIIEHFLRQKKELLKYLYSMPKENWNRSGVHETEGHVSFKEFIRRMIKKDSEIIGQIANQLPAN